MANTYTALHYHAIFSTKNRERWITSDVELCIWGYLGGIARENRIVIAHNRWGRGSRALGTQSATHFIYQQGTPIAQRCFLEMDSRYVPRAPWIWMAGWL